MDLRFSAADEAFREEVRAFLSARLTPDLRAYAARMTSVYADKPTALAWQAILVAQGWAVPSWPVEYGGCDWSVAQHYIWQSELARAGAPPLSPMGLSMCGPALIGHGSDAQKAYYLPRMLNAQDFWCQGYSEPHAGSDLATLSMSAVPDGDDFICNGAKIWTTHAHEANMMFCLVRTSTLARPQQGITFLLIDMTSPGVTVTPIISLTGEHIQNTCFFENVRAPRVNVVGAIDDGWTVAKYLLEFERGGSAYGPRLLQRLDAIKRAARTTGCDDAEMMRKIGEAEIAAAALEQSELRAMAALSHGGAPRSEQASMHKILGTELSQRLTELSLEIAGDYAAPYQPHLLATGGPTPGHRSNAGQVGPDEALTATAKYFNDRAGSIYAGSNEIQRNILTKAALRL